jgi:hypothetical protein
VRAATLRMTAFGIMTLGITALSTKTLKVMTLSIIMPHIRTTVCIPTKYNDRHQNATRDNDTLHNDT